MSMNGRTAVIFGGSGAVGGAVGEALAQQGAHVHLCARSPERLEEAASRVRWIGGRVETVELDVLDAQSVTGRMADVARARGGMDIVVNATGFMHDQGKELADLTEAEFMGGVVPFLAAQFNIAKAVAPHMGGKRGGTFITIVAPAGRMAAPGHLGHITGCAGLEAFTKALASELGPRNIRVLCLRSHAIADAIEAGSHTEGLFAPKARAMGLSVQDWLGGAARGTMLGRLPTLSQVAQTIAFLASDGAAAMTSTVVNMTAGVTTD
jgi:3-oxoacyl-[acyl-carrier protein] reductase